ncbi:MAG: hypothetical protein ABI194_05350 [Gemmatimonadaceae bacterium]
MSTSNAVFFRVSTFPARAGGVADGTAGDQHGETGVVVETPPLMGGASATAALWALLVQRVERAIVQALSKGPMAVDDLQRILAERSDVGATAALLAHSATAASVIAVDPLAEAKARAVQAEQELLEAAGGTLTTDGVARLLSVTRQAVEKRRDRRTLLGLQLSSGSYVYPVCQFGTGEVLPGLDQFLAAFPRHTDAWLVLNVLLGSSDALGDQTPLSALRLGKVNDAVEVAEAAFDERD